MVFLLCGLFFAIKGKGISFSLPARMLRLWLAYDCTKKLTFSLTYDGKWMYIKIREGEMWSHKKDFRYIVKTAVCGHAVYVIPHEVA